MKPPWHEGIVLFTISCAIVAALIVIPPEYGRWIALGLLAVVVVTPAVSRSHRGAAQRTRGRGSSGSR